MTSITISESREITREAIIDLYEINGWSAAEKPELLYKALQHSHALVTAWDGDQLVGLGNAISDGYLVVYFPHLLIHPAHYGQSIGRRIMEKMQQKYQGFHMQILTADYDAVEFYQKIGFEKAGDTVSMWIYDGVEH